MMNRVRALAARLFALLLMTVGVVACSSGTTAPDPPQPGDRKILFIGNSFTYTNDLPEMVKQLARKAGVNDLYVRSVTFGGVSLEDHWYNGAARQLLAEEEWDLVIMQQGPSSQADGRVVLMEYAHRFDTEIRAAGGRPAFYMVWPDISRPGDFDGVSRNYRAAADSTNGMLFPAGEAWRAVIARDANIRLYSPDGLHPTQLGTYLVALVMVGQITGRQIVGMPETVTIGGDFGYTLRVPPGVARLLQEEATRAVRDFGRM